MSLLTSLTIRDEGLRHRETIALALMIIITILAIIDFNFSILKIDHFSVSGVETADAVGVYWDSNCRVRVHSIDWGVLQPGEVRKVVIYVRNQWNESFILFSTTMNWNPKIASYYLNFSCTRTRVEEGEIVEVIPTLSVPPLITGVSNFSFDIVFQGRKYLGDINDDRIVNIIDISTIAVAYGSTPQDSSWNPYVDLNNDRTINVLDLALAAKDFAKTYGS